MAIPRLAAGVLFAACLAGLLLPPGAPSVVLAQGADRQLYVSALDRTGAPVAGLGVNDFIVREDGVSREVLNVRPATAPMQIAVLVDTSQAATSSMKDIRDALKAFFNKMQEGNEIALIGFGDRPTILSDYTNSRITLDKGVGRLFGMPGSGAYLLDAVVEVSQGIQKREAGRPVIVALTTEGTEYSNVTYQTVLKRLSEAGAAFHALVLTSVGGGGMMSEEARNRLFLFDQGTRATGGRRDDLLTSMAFEGALTKLAAELSSQYLVTYSRPQSLIPPEKTEISTPRPNLTVRGTPVRSPKGA